jgi:hypothetical protein
MASPAGQQVAGMHGAAQAAGRVVQHGQTIPGVNAPQMPSTY